MLRQLPSPHKSLAPPTTRLMMTIITSIYGAPISGWALGQTLYKHNSLSILHDSSHCHGRSPEKQNDSGSRTQLTRAGLRPSSHFLAFISFCSCHWCLFLFSSPKYGHFPRFSLSSLKKLFFSKSLSHCGQTRQE